MRHGADHILKIPGSGNLVAKRTLLSGNTFYLTRWTDGKWRSAMLPDDPWLRVHPETREFLWTDECEREYPPSEFASYGPRPHAYKDVPYAVEPEIEEYVLALGLDALTPVKEIYIRRRYWWLANDPVRIERSFRLSAMPRYLFAWITKKPVQYSGLLMPAGGAEFYRQNLLRLIELVEAEPDSAAHRLLLADAYRSLGDFDHSADLLGDYAFDEDKSPIALTIRKLIDRRDRLVAEVSW
ncbi:MAG: hypothetical protein ACAI35_06870 [Candidatus Methylacidiphilales bacterium]|nr:hypothetical protein [Candidatus Methylacidiphilales bacterium]